MCIFMVPLAVPSADGRSAVVAIPLCEAKLKTSTSRGVSATLGEISR